MAIFVRSKNSLFSRLISLTRFKRCKHTLGETDLHSQMPPIDRSKWKRINASKLGITGSMISFPSWIVLNTLNRGGFQAYLVGGCVRDLLLNRIPKDFDVITTADLEQIKKKFHRAEIIGRRFPICRVHIEGSVIEVSSFKTVAKNDEHREKTLSSLIPNGCDENDLIRWSNSMNRDFTINSLFFDPITSKIYDYNDGMSDLKSLKLRTLIPAHVSFQEDCARILRGLRIAARLGLSFSKDTESAMRDLSSSIEGLDKFRLMLELNYMLSYGAALSSIRLLQRFDLLKILLPFQDVYINQQRSAQNVMMLMKLFFNLDKLVSCEHPADCSLWIALLMFHMALVNHPQDALVVTAFASVLYHGRWKEGVQFAREHTDVEVKFVPEISGFSESKSDEDLAKEITQFASLVQGSVCTLTETSGLIESMSRFPYFECSGLVFVPKKIASDTAKIFDLMVDDIESFINQRRRGSPDINYQLLGKGDPCETRYVLGKIILETTMDGLFGGGIVRTKGQKSLLQTKVIERHSASTQLLLKDKKRAPSVLNPEAKQGMPKKQKLVDRNYNPPELYTAIKKQEVVTEEELGNLANKDQKLVKTCKLPEKQTNLMQRNISEKEKGNLSNQGESMAKEENKRWKHRKASKKQKEVDGNCNLRQDEIVNWEKQNKRWKHRKASKKQKEVDGNCNLRQDEIVNWEKLLGKEVKEKDKKRGRTLLSSLFR